MVVMFSGWPAIYLLKNYDSVKPDQSIKPRLMLTGDLLGAYLGVCFLHYSHDTLTHEAPVCRANHVRSPSSSSHFLSSTNSYMEQGSAQLATLKMPTSCRISIRNLSPSGHMDSKPGSKRFGALQNDVVSLIMTWAHSSMTWTGECT